MDMDMDMDMDMVMCGQHMRIHIIDGEK